MSKLFTSLVFLILSSTLFAQFPGARMGGGSANMNVGHFYGKIVDSKTNKGIEGVTVQISGNRFDTVAKKWYKPF